MMHPLEKLKLTIARRKLSSRKINEGTDNALEEWIHNKIRAEFKASNDLRETIGRKELGKIERRDVREYQLHKLL